MQMVYDWAAEGEISKVIANKMATMPPPPGGGNETWLLPFWSAYRCRCLSRSPSNPPFSTRPT